MCSSDLLVGLVMIDDPRNKQYYGGQVAGPVFSRVMQSAVRQLQLAPDGTPLTNTAAAPTPPPTRDPRT